MIAPVEPQPADVAVQLLVAGLSGAACSSALLMNDEADEVQLQATLKRGRLDQIDVVLLRKGQPVAGFGQ